MPSHNKGRPSKSPTPLFEKLNRNYQTIAKDPIISGLISTLLGALALVIFRAIFPCLRGDLLIIFSIVGVLVFLVVLRSRKSWTLSGLIALFIVAILALLFNREPAPRGTAYLIFDLSENMEEPLSRVNVQDIMNLALQQVPDNLDVGLMLTGHVLSDDEDECSRAEQLVPPASKITNTPLMIEKLTNLASFRPQGPANIEHAILEAIKELAGRPKVHEVIVITSGLDERCHILDKELIEFAATQSNVEFALTIILVNTQLQPEEQTKYKRFADKLHYVETADRIPQAVSTVVDEPIFSYFSPPQ